MEKSLENKWGIITGSSRGIGQKIAEEAASKGANLIICATQTEKAEAVAQDIAKTYGVETRGFGLDVSSEADCKALIEFAMTECGRIDFLVNNAGITKDNLMLRMSLEDWQAVLDVNLNSVFLLSKAALRPMMKQRGGRIINISSVVGVIGNAGQANYAATKAGMIGFTKSLAREYASKGIIANVVAPGYVETDMIESLPKEYLDNIIKNIPLGRLGRAEDVAKLVCFLASDEARYITGEVFKIDGGLSM